MLRKRKKQPDPTKRLGKSLVSKGPARDPEHLAKVRRQPCVACSALGFGVSRVSEAHHVRSIGPRTMGKRVSDYITTPLCVHHHRELHNDGEAHFWHFRRIDPAAWIYNFSPEGKAAIEALARPIGSNQQE